MRTKRSFTDIRRALALPGRCSGRSRVLRPVVRRPPSRKAGMAVVAGWGTPSPRDDGGEGVIMPEDAGGASGFRGAPETREQAAPGCVTGLGAGTANAYGCARSSRLCAPASLDRAP